VLQEELANIGFGREPFDSEHEQFRETVRRFFQRQVAPNVRQWEKDGFFPAELFREAGKAGLLCSGMPVEYGGGGGDVRHHVILHEEHCFAPSGASLESGLTTDISTYCVFNTGTEEQKKEWIPSIAAGETIIEIGLSEAGAGSDVQGIKTSATRDGGDYIINGHKMWVSNGPILTTLLLLAKTRSADGRDSFSMFIVPMDMKGVTRSKPTDLLLKNCGGVCEVYFDNVRVPARNILGGVEGRGLKAALSMLTTGRVVTSARAMATSELALALTLDFVKQRQAFGQRVFDFQNTQFKLASVATEIAAGRALTDYTIKRLVAGTCDDVSAAKAKLFTSEAEGRILDECLQLHGGAGFSNEQPISKMYTLGRVHRVYGGTSEVMRSIIGRSMA
jgi:alkylation response protein AidB-like acyl-CoA dehydrogenase